MFWNNCVKRYSLYSSFSSIFLLFSHARWTMLTIHSECYFRLTDFNFRYHRCSLKIYSECPHANDYARKICFARKYVQNMLPNLRTGDRKFRYVCYEFRRTWSWLRPLTDSADRIGCSLVQTSNTPCLHKTQNQSRCEVRLWRDVRRFDDKLHIMWFIAAIKMVQARRWHRRTTSDLQLIRFALLSCYTRCKCYCLILNSTWLVTSRHVSTRHAT